MKKVLCIIISFFFFSCVVSANTINNINMDITINEAGNAHIKEVWNTNLDQGTEGYKSFDNLGNADIIDFSVSDDSGVNYESLNIWDSNLSFYQKAYKSAVTRGNDKLELCWGISKYGNRTYYLEYGIINFVNQYKDNQGIYFKLINLNQDVNKVKINISSVFQFNLQTSKIWGMGYDGNINFYNNKIVIETDNILSKTQFVALLVRFENNYFDTSNFIDKTFDEIYEEANLNYEKKKSNNYVIKNDNRYKSNTKLTFKEKVNLYMPIFGGAFIIFLILLPFCRKNIDLSDYNFKYVFKSNNKLFSLDDIKYYRDIPYKNIILVYFILMRYSSYKEKNIIKKKIISCFLLKWILEKKIIFKNNDIYFNNIDNIVIDDILEKKLYDYLILSSKDNILNIKSFKKWNKKNYDKMLKWYGELDLYSITYFEKQKLITGFNKDTKKVVIADKMKSEAIKIFGVKKFLLDFGRMYEKKSSEVILWEYYLIYSELFNIADKVKKELKKYYPYVEMDFEELDSLEIMINNISDFIYNCINSEYDNYRIYVKNKKNNRYKIFSYDYDGSSNKTGGGGRSSSSGGKSSGGSSGGGFR